MRVARERCRKRFAREIETSPGALCVQRDDESVREHESRLVVAKNARTLKNSVADGGINRWHEDTKATRRRNFRLSQVAVPLPDYAASSFELPPLDGKHIVN